MFYEERVMADYIDREALIKSLGITNIKDCKECDWGDGRGFCKRDGGFADACYQIEELPSADVRENVRGEWIESNDEMYGSGCWKCSNCGYGYSYEAYFEVNDFNFCPNCGADMRGESDE